MVWVGAGTRSQGVGGETAGAVVVVVVWWCWNGLGRGGDEISGSWGETAGAVVVVVVVVWWCWSGLGLSLIHI